MRAKPKLRSWVWPPPPVARRLWLTIAAASLYSLAVYAVGRSTIAELPPWSSEFGLVNGIVLGVLVGLRVRAAFDRWTDGQKLWAEVVVHSRNLALKAAHFLRGDAADRRAVELLLGRYAGALMNRLRDTGPTEHVPLQLAGQLHALAAEWFRAGKLDLPGLWAWEANVRALADAAGNCERVALAPVPASFHALLRHGLLVSLVLAPWHLIHALALWALPVQALIIYFLFGIELTAEEIENPFGTDADDLPLDTFCETVRRDVADIFATAGAPAAPLPAPSAAAVGAATPTVIDGKAG
ncbi:MAG: hypothetical protein FJ304_01525 [Planctomycetes bacterium]|nr:hypothetical protein [Planctomycetota bacterium]